ncbi:hypothetical protein VP01_4601g1 [Puccinia sorghi]|uniref:Uncharacterized protein n=1 Tax=Puccinia sorghi TaxID=27349 RepID=A0A0L6UNH0_9BASI|nr:hypothetical protein VP01_4601g1 [Puccinia sorghi]
MVQLIFETDIRFSCNQNVKFFKPNLWEHIIFFGFTSKNFYIGEYPSLTPIKNTPLLLLFWNCNAERDFVLQKDDPLFFIPTWCSATWAWTCANGMGLAADLGTWGQVLLGLNQALDQQAHSPEGRFFFLFFLLFLVFLNIFLVDRLKIMFVIDLNIEVNKKISGKLHCLSQDTHQNKINEKANVYCFMLVYPSRQGKALHLCHNPISIIVNQTNSNWKMISNLPGNNQEDYQYYLGHFQGQEGKWPDFHFHFFLISFFLFQILGEGYKDICNSFKKSVSWKSLCGKKNLWHHLDRCSSFFPKSLLLARNHSNKMRNPRLSLLHYSQNSRYKKKSAMQFLVRFLRCLSQAFVAQCCRKCRISTFTRAVSMALLSKCFYITFFNKLQAELRMKLVVTFVDFNLNNQPNTVKDHNENVLIHAQGLMFFLEIIITHISYVHHSMTFISFFFSDQIENNCE